MEEDGPENAWPSRASVPEDYQQTASLTQTLDPENAQRSQSLADEAGAQLQHTRTSLASRLQIQRHDDDAWGEAASQTGQENHREEAAVTKERQGSHSGSKATNDKNLAWQRTRPAGPQCNGMMMMLVSLPVTTVVDRKGRRLTRKDPV